MAVAGGAMTAVGGVVAAAMTGGAMCMVIASAERQAVQRRMVKAADMGVVAAGVAGGEQNN